MRSSRLSLRRIAPLNLICLALGLLCVGAAAQAAPASPKAAAFVPNMPPAPAWRGQARGRSEAFSPALASEFVGQLG